MHWVSLSKNSRSNLPGLFPPKDGPVSIVAVAETMQVRLIKVCPLGKMEAVAVFVEALQQDFERWCKVANIVLSQIGWLPVKLEEGVVIQLVGTETADPQLLVDHKLWQLVFKEIFESGVIVETVHSIPVPPKPFSANRREEAIKVVQSWMKTAVFPQIRYSHRLAVIHPLGLPCVGCKTAFHLLGPSACVRPSSRAL
jgi:hypothetical protein